MISVFKCRFLLEFYIYHCLSYFMLNMLLTTYIHICILVIPLLFYLKPRYILLAITAVYVLYSNQHHQEQTELYYQISALLAMLMCLKHNRRHTKASIVWLIFLSIGILLSGLLKDNKIFLTQVIQYIDDIGLLKTYFDNKSIINSLHTMASWMLIGLIPFSTHIMHLFTVSNNFFKTLCFIIPMFLFQFVIQLHNNSTTTLLLIFGNLTCIHSGIHCIIESNIRLLLVYMITYFYGLNTIAITQHPNNTKLYNTIWLILCVAILAYNKIIAPRKTQTYLIHNIKTLICNTKTHIVLSVWFYIILTSILLLYYQTTNIHSPIHDQFYLFAITLSVALTAKLVYILFFTNNNTDILLDNKTETIKTTILFFFTTIYIVCVFLTKTPAKHNIYSAKQIIYRLTFLLMFFITSFLLSKFLITPKKTTLFKTIQNNNIQKILDIFKTVVDIVYISITDFFKVVKNNIQSTLSSSIPNKLTNLLNNNQVYFYIFFLIEIIVVLTIECVIT